MVLSVKCLELKLGAVLLSAPTVTGKSSLWIPLVPSPDPSLGTYGRAQADLGLILGMLLDGAIA